MSGEAHYFYDESGEAVNYFYVTDDGVEVMEEA
jgi:hypothetical protein